MIGFVRLRGPAAAIAVVCAIACALVQAACGDAAGPDYVAAAASITAGDMRGWIAALSHDSMRGRWTPSPELDKAAATIAARFQQLRLEPPFNGDFVQIYPVIEADTQPPPYPEAPNVAAIVRGSDAALRGEYVLLVAHMDHVGTWATGGTRCTPVGADSLCNGADDNASGTAAIIEIAEALTLLKVAPRRSIMLLLTSGEEHGMHGASYFVANPPVPISQIVAAVSLDMISRNSPDTITGIGLPYTTLGSAMQAQALAHPELGLEVVGDLWPGSNLFYRSDHIRFANVGVPSLFFFSGPTLETHTAANTVDLVDADKAARVARLAFYLACAVAEEPARPQWLRAPDPPVARAPGDGAPAM